MIKRDHLAKATDLATLIAAVALVALIWARVPGLGKESRAAPAGPKVGDTISIDGVTWGQGQTVVLFLSTECPYCRASAGLYQEIAKHRRRGALRMVAVFSEELERAEGFLKTHDITVDQVVRARPGTAGVTAVPTLLIVDSTGVLVDLSRGRLTQESEGRVLKRISDG